MGAGIVHQDHAERRDLRQKPSHLIFANRHVAVTEEKVDRTVDFHLQARLVAQVDEVGEWGRGELLFRRFVDLRIKLAGDDASKSVHPERFGDPKSAYTHE